MTVGLQLVWCVSVEDIRKWRVIVVEHYTSSLCPTGARKAMIRELDSGQRRLIEPRYLALDLGRHGFGGTLARYASR